MLRRIVCGVALVLALTGCGRFMAARMMQAPNTYPTWLAPVAPVELNFADIFLTNFPPQFIEIESPPARLRYRVVEPAEYRFRTSHTNWVENDQRRYRISFRAEFPAVANDWTMQPRGTVVLLHGYGVGMFAMAPWALDLAQHGWRSVMVDLRGHGKSTGRKIYYGLQETGDLRQLLDDLQSKGRVVSPVMVLGESYGANLALRWSVTDARIERVVALTPYNSLSNSILNICHEYSDWMPKWWLRAGLQQLPQSLNTTAEDLHGASVMRRNPAPTFFIAGGADRITPPAMVDELFQLASGPRQMLTVPEVTHEAAPFFFDALEAPIVEWLNAGANGAPVGH